MVDIIYLMLVKLVNIVPRSWLIKFGYSRLGSKLVTQFKKNNSRKFFETDQGIFMHLDITNPHTWDLIQKRDPEQKIKQVFAYNLKAGNTVIDVGAHIGEFSLIASKKVGNEGKIIAIEPLIENAKWIQKNLSLNEIKNCLVLELAVGSKRDKVTIYKKNVNASMGILDPQISEEKLVKSYDIEVETLDAILTERKIDNVDMLKIDVEGYEYEVLTGCKELMRQKKIKKIICEIHSQYLAKKGVSEDMLYSLLRDNGFKVDNIEEEAKNPHIFAYLSQL